MSYTLHEPKYTIEECHEKGMTYASPIKVHGKRLLLWDKDAETGAQSIRDIKEHEVYFGEIPSNDRERKLHYKRYRAGNR